MHNCFHAADILIPQHISLKKWSCIATDQYSSQIEYWDRVADFVGDAPSTLKLIYPEAILRERPEPGRPETIHRTMEQYCNAKMFQRFRRSFIYVERVMLSGKKRRGIVGQIDLEEYDFEPGASAYIRATEGTVLDRIPPRMDLLREALLEFPHVLLLCDDRKDAIMSAAERCAGELVYDFDLMEDGGHITGRLISGLGVSIVNSAVSEYIAAIEYGKSVTQRMAFAVGDGNHSLAAAKACWDEIKGNLTAEEFCNHPARFALVELENIHDSAIEFEPIHRVILGAEFSSVLKALLESCASTEDDGYPVELVSGMWHETVYIPRKNTPLALAVLQPVLDHYIAEHKLRIDYIHGADVVRDLSRDGENVGIILPGIDKNKLFEGVLYNGVLPRKTFSMGHACEKRYYLEGKYRR